MVIHARWVFHGLRMKPFWESGWMWVIILCCKGSERRTHPDNGSRRALEIQEYSRVKYQNIVVAKTLHFWSLLHGLNLRIRCWTKMLSDNLRLDPWDMQRHAKINYVQGVQHRDHVVVQSCPGMARRGPSHRVGPEREAGRSIWVRNWGLSQAGWPLYDHGQVPRGTWI